MTTLPALPWTWPLAGGLMIGIAAGAWLLVAGRIAGISGLIAQATGVARGGRMLPALFVLGLLIGAWAALALLGERARIELTDAWPALAAGGLLVGYGTRLGSGCTSGHGVCGLARGSPRSIAATAVFMAAGFATVHVLRHVLGVWW